MSDAEESPWRLALSLEPAQYIDRSGGRQAGFVADAKPAKRPDFNSFVVSGYHDRQYTRLPILPVLT
jgi:hypothetical protein